jgi:hypothetical protein
MAATNPDEKLRVFISYSRRDSSEFAEELVAALELAGFAPSLDRNDIALGEDWQARLGVLIEECDTVVFVISPEAMKSERCNGLDCLVSDLSLPIICVIGTNPHAPDPEGLASLPQEQLTSKYYFPYQSDEANHPVVMYGYAVMQQSGRYRGRSGNFADTLIRSLLTHSNTLWPSIAALRRVQFAERPLRNIGAVGAL